jgi:hypothetical protein
MSDSKKRWQVVGYSLHALVGVVMIAAGAPKVLGLAPAEHIEAMGIAEHIRIVGAGELITGALLMIPRTESLAILLTSAFWGGAISVHMTHAQSYFVPAVFLVLSWIGAYLRVPALLASFRRHPKQSEAVASALAP